MHSRILKKEFKKNKAVNITVFLFILLSALLISGATNTIYTLIGSVDNFFAQSKAPDFTQSHVGTIDQKKIDEFSKNNKLVQDQQTVEMISIDGAILYISGEDKSEAESAMDVSFVTQNKKFDFILGMDNKPAQVKEHEIAVPIYYMEQKDLKVGDSIWIKTDTFEKEFVISEFTRDAQMNPSLINSKRFVINDKAFAEVSNHIKENELLIEFILKDQGKAGEFTSEYVDAKLPAGGYTIDQSILKLFNALSDVLVAGLIIFMSILLITIALFCLRFTLLSTIEDEYREIGVMKAIGMSLKDIRRLYMTKYTILSLAACFLGYLLSLITSDLFTEKITLYMGEKTPSAIDYLIPVTGSLLIFGLVLLACRIILRKFKKISAVEAIRSGRRADNGKAHTRIKVSKTRAKNMNVFLGIRDVLVRLRAYILLFVVLIICTFIMVMPINFATTMNDSEFLTYMGAPKCDIRVDLQSADDMDERGNGIKEVLSKDKEVSKFAQMVTCNYKILNDEGTYDNMTIESGELNKFPLEYVEGKAPSGDHQIALSYAKATDLNKSLGDAITLLYKGEDRTMKISGIYQDITNGGKTAKVALPHDPDTVLWYTTCIDLSEGVDKENKIESLSEQLRPAKVTDTQEYMSQTLGVMIDRLTEITILSAVIAIFIALLITALFFNLLISKDAGDIAILNSLGYSFKHIRTQYMVRAVFTAIAGIILGIIAVMTLGTGLVNVAGGFMGMASFQFIVNPILIYVLVPIMLIVTIVITMLVVTRKINHKFSIREIIE